MRKYVVLAFAAVVLLVVFYDREAGKRPVEQSFPPSSSEALVTFVELGSDSCVPCRAMQPVMRDLEKKFGDQIRILYYDILKNEAPARAYEIRVMPTQVFLDQNGREFHRHEGFYPLAEIESLLRARGLKE